MSETMIYDKDTFNEAMIDEIIKEVIDILEERGYNAVNQLVGYLMSGDPGYISSHKEARSKITNLDRAKVLEVILKNYLGK